MFNIIDIEQVVQVSIYLVEVELKASIMSYRFTFVRDLIKSPS